MLGTDRRDREARRRSNLSCLESEVAARHGFTSIITIFICAILPPPVCRGPVFQSDAKRVLILLRHKRLEGADSETAGAAWESVGECGGDASSERGDGVWDVALGAQGRSVRGRDRGKRKMFGRGRRGDVLRGESSAVRRSGNRKRRCTAWRDGGSRASRDLRNGRGRPPVSTPDNRVRCASAV